MVSILDGKPSCIQVSLEVCPKKPTGEKNNLLDKVISHKLAIVMGKLVTTHKWLLNHYSFVPPKNLPIDLPFFLLPKSAEPLFSKPLNMCIFSLGFGCFNWKFLLTNVGRRNYFMFFCPLTLIFCILRNTLKYIIISK